MQAARAASTLPAPSCPPQPLASTSATPTSAVDRIRMWASSGLSSVHPGSRPGLTPRTASALYAEHSVPAVAVMAEGLLLMADLLEDKPPNRRRARTCLLYTSDAADERS